MNINDSRVDVCQLTKNYRGWFSSFCDDVEMPLDNTGKPVVITLQQSEPKLIENYKQTPVDNFDSGFFRQTNLDPNIIPV